MKSIRTSKYYIIAIQNVLMCWYLDVMGTKVIIRFIHHVHELCSIFHVTKPSTVYAGRMDQRLLYSRTLYSWGVMLTGDQPHFLWPVLSFAADSSTNTSWSTVYEASLHIHSTLSSELCCAAHICIYKLKKQPKIDGKQHDDDTCLFDHLTHFNICLIDCSQTWRPKTSQRW